MTTTDPLAPFQWLNVSENEGGGALGVIFSVAFFRGLDPAEVVRRFSRGQDSGHESDFGGLGEKAYEFIAETEGGYGGGYVGAFQDGEWCVAIEPDGWMATDHVVVTELSRGCEVLAVTRHDYAAEHSFEYAIDSTIVTSYRLRYPYERYGSDPDRLNGFMRELGMGLDKPEDDAAWDAAWEGNYYTAVPRGFALAAKVTGVPLTPDMLGRPMLVGPIVVGRRSK
ncbi:DUF6461 domain-containing protein [Microbispora triticiradicis]|uniref:Uncharacterized protein n=2 Tax=Microbispora TaxID=2005 RepID=A0ABY3LSL7_9ACTN|nr:MULTISPECIES: DUF6461 domain-containing protein [Microbispora]TLP57862.1 hypothetical protein FED44_20065 [Microbispora fusca]TYB52330.1 hypothetical protein FXF59_24950 [Microbispora tritici]